MELPEAEPIQAAEAADASKGPEIFLPVEVADGKAWLGHGPEAKGLAVRTSRAEGAGSGFADGLQSERAADD